MPPSYFVSNGCKMQMPNETWTFDLLCNSFPNEELTDSETRVFFMPPALLVGRLILTEVVGSSGHPVASNTSSSAQRF